ncbi:hypothetical protein KKG58_04590 [Patescibacteria group bacterium]|nr:hypothetical protein [Patescibacteria group bacterium]
MKQIKFKVNLPVSIFREGKSFVAYTPVLDLSTSGKTYNEVRKRFSEIVKIFFNETAMNGDLNTVLLDLGWKKIKTEWTPPVLVSQRIENVEMALKT